MTNQLSLSLYDELISSFDEIDNTVTSDVLQHARAKGLKSFKNSGFPTRRNEEWKYTNITPYLQEKYSFTNVETAASDVVSWKRAPSPVIFKWAASAADDWGPFVFKSFKNLSNEVVIGSL